MEGEMKSSIHLTHSRPVRRGRLWAGMNGATKSKAELMKLRSALLKRSRTAREQCVVPDKLLYRYDVGEEGAMVVCFSSSGHILAIAAKGSSLHAVPLSREGTYSRVIFQCNVLTHGTSLLAYDVNE